MAAVSETIVREYFELHGFFVRQQRKFISRARRDPGDDEIDFLVLNPLAEPRPEPLPFVLASANLHAVARALVVVKGWHTDTFGPGVLANAPEIFRALEPSVFKQASRLFGSDARLSRLLVMPALPSTDEARRQSIEMLRAKGVDAVIPFRTMLADLIEQIDINRNYQKSDLLQIIRILKNYEFFRGPQLELFRTRRHPPKQP
ncbi:MAG: hypothetical protein JXQ71_05490 [Verrucomicrobia bacterium]|nr:hypothetical protein [Verrucomicrobiota bacterium]